MKIVYKRLIEPELMTSPMNATTGRDIFKEYKPKITTWNNLLRTCGGTPHSPIRSIVYRFYITDVPYWVSVHYVRHNIGVQFYIQSQRTDRTGINRNELPQGSLVNMVMDVNPNALINIAKARLCSKASKETKEVLLKIKEELDKGDEYDKSLARFLMPPCGWSNTCFELQPCKKQYRGRGN